MANIRLSEGALQVIMQGGEVIDPIMQVLGSKKIVSAGNDKERYRILLSDGKYTISFAMLTTQINDKFGNNQIANNSVIKIKRFITSVINNTNKGKPDTRVLIILEMELVAPGDDVGTVIGSPIPLEKSEETSGGGFSSSTSSGTGTSKPGPSVSENGGSSSAARSSAHTAPNGTSNLATSDTSASTMSTTVSLQNSLTHPISSLSPYQNKWVIRARVMNKSNIRSWSNSRGEGKLFSVDLCDESGEIRCTGFRDSVDKFYNYLEVDKVYYISKCTLKPANKQYNVLKNDYEMTMTPETIIEECTEDDPLIPQTKYDFVTIDKIANTEVNTIVDVIGVCKSASDLVKFQSKAGRELQKKEVILVDPSNNSIALTLWGADAENFDGSKNPVVVAKGVKISEFGGGKTLSLFSSSLLKVNPDIPECHRMRGWYDSEGRLADTTNVSARSGAGGSFNTPWMSFKEVTDSGLGHEERGSYYQLVGTVLLIRSENLVYKACPSETCNKKVIDLENGLYRCEKCNREYPNFKYRMLLSMNVGDWSGNQWISLFSDEGAKVLGMGAEELGESIAQNPEAASEICLGSHFKQFMFKCRAKFESYNDEMRLKTIAVKVEDVNYEEYNDYLIKRINKYVDPKNPSEDF